MKAILGLPAMRFACFERIGPRPVKKKSEAVVFR